jgi:hypothetical protein
MSDIPEGYELVSDIPEGYEVVGGASSPSSITTLPNGVKVTIDGRYIGPDGRPIDIQKPSIGQKAVGAGEAGLSNLTGMTTGYLGGALSAVNNVAGTIGRAVTGTPMDGRIGPEEAFKQGSEALTYHPRTETGEDYSAAVGEAVNRYGVPMIGVGHTMPPVVRNPKLPSELRSVIPEVKVPEGYEVVKPGAKQLDLNLNEGVAQHELSDVGSQAPQYGVRQGQGHWVTDENGHPVRADLSMEAQNLENPLQRNLWGDELARKSEQEGVPLTEAIDSMPWAQRRGAINRELTGDIPASGELRSAMMEAEGGPKIQGTGEFSTTPEGLKFGNADRPAFEPNNPLLTKKLGDMVKEAVDNGGSIIIKSPDNKQMGAINMDIFDPAFKAMKDLANGIRLVFQGDEGAPYIKAYRDGKEVGQLKLQSENMIPDEKGNLQAAWVDSGAPGLAKEMYKFAAEKGNDLTPAKTQTAAGKAMWQSFEKQGLSNKGKINRQRGAIDSKVLDHIAKQGQEALMKVYNQLFDKWSAAGPSERQEIRAEMDQIIHKVSELDIRDKRIAGLQRQQPIEVFPGYTHIPSGTKVLATHGLKYAEPTRATVVGTKDIRLDDGPYRLPVVDFGDGQPRTLAPYDIKEVYGPRPLSTNKQRGAINIKDIADGLRALVSPTAIRGADKIPFERTALDSYHEIPGMKEATKDYIPADPDVKAVIEQAKMEGGENGKIALKSLRAGAGMVGEQRNSAVVKATGRIILNGVKRAERNIRNIVEPFEKSIGRLRASEVEGLGSLLKEEMFDGVEHTPAQLAERGMSPKAIDAYQKTRDMFSKVLQEMNEARLEMGMDPVTPRQAYLSSRWTGSFRIPVYDKAGKLVWYIAETSKRKAENALEYLSKNGVDVDPSKSKLEFAQYGEKSRGSLEDAYLTMLSVLDKNDPRVKEVQGIMEDAMANNSYDTLGQARHFEPKGNVRGFVGDRPWRDSSKEAYSMLKQQTQYAKNGFQWAESQRAVAKVKEILSDPDLMEQQPNNLEYARQYVKNHLGFGENQVIRTIENTLAKAVGIDKAGVYDAVGMAKGLFLTMKLTANLGYYVSQGLQMLNSISEHAYLDSQGYKHNPFKTMTRANLDFSAGAVHGIMDILSGGKSPQLKMSKLGEEAWNYMEQNGISNRNILDEAQGLGEHKIAGAIKSVADYPVAKSEQIIRTNTFLQFVHHLDQSGKFTNMSELFQKAEEATNRSMVDFRREERAMLFAQMGVTGRAAETLKSYLVNYYNNLGRYSQEAINGRPKALTYFLGVQALLYGAMNIPGVTEINDGWDLIKKSMPDAVFEKIKDIDVKKFLIQHMGDYSYGGVSKLTGANLSNRGNVALDQSFALDGLFPFITDAYKQAKAVGQAAMNPNQSTLMQAAYQTAPSGPIQGNIAMSKPFQAGQNPNGETIFQKPSRLVDHEHDFDRTPDQIAKKKWGFTDLQEAKYKDLTYLQNQDEADLGNRRKELINKIFDSMVRGDTKDKQTYIDRYIRFNGDPDQLVANLTQEAYKMRVSPEKLQAINSSSIPALKKIQALQQLVGQIR